MSFLLSLQKSFLTNLFDRLNLPIESCRSTLNQGYIRSQAHFVDMPSRIEVVKCVEDERKALEPLYVELRIFDVCMVRLELDVRIEFGGTLLCDLNQV